MNGTSIFETLMSLPLFNGASRERIAEVAGKSKLHFLKYSDGDQILERGEPCDHLRFIMTGRVRLKMTCGDARISVEQILQAPSALAPEFLFGRSVTYPYDVEAIENVGVLQVSKKDFMKILNLDPVFMFNFLNIISANAQKAVDGVLSVVSGTVEHRLAFWVVALSQRQSTDIALRGTSEALRAAFGVAQTELEQSLSSLKKRGLIDYTATEIKVLSRDGLEALL